jgi:hypothetical protein
VSILSEKEVKMIFEWIKITVPSVFGFVGASVVQLLAFSWQERAQKKLLRKSLYRELVAIYVRLRNLLPHLSIEGPIRREPFPANFPVLVGAECFNTARSSPLFWRLKDAFGMVQAHENFGFLAVPNPRDFGTAAIDMCQVLNVFYGLIENGKLSRRDLLGNADGQLTKADLAAPGPRT